MNKKTATILVIEDNLYLLEGLIGILSFYNYRVQGIAHHQEVDVEMLCARPPDLIILDAMLGGADGRDLAKEFKAREPVRQVPILMMSAQPGIEKSAREAGADDFLPKPFELDELINKIQAHLASGDGHNKNGNNGSL
jgi:DNA-binding response OmpR family regulator